MRLFVSDLHLGSPMFNRDKDLIRLFSLEKVTEIYLVGDVYDSWELDPLDIFYRHEELITTINFIDKPVFIFIGNHDPSKSFMKEVFFNVPVLDSMELDICGKRVLVVHGHEASTDSKIAHRVFFIQYYMGRWLKINPKAVLRDFWHKFLTTIKGNKDGLVLKMEREIYEYYRGKYDIVICGHTHVGKIVQCEELLFINSGCIIHKPTYILSDGCSMFLEEL